MSRRKIYVFRCPQRVVFARFRVTRRRVELLVDVEAADRERHKRLQRVYYAANRDAIREYQRVYREANREKIRAYNRAYQRVWRAAKRMESRQEVPQ
jgi:hypothetical protein